MTRLHDTFLAGIAVETDECVLWPHGKRASGYGQMGWDGKNRRVHTVACELVHGPRPFQGAIVAHSCRNRHCFNPRHLRWATMAENHADRIADGTDFRGSKNPYSKLTEGEVREIRKLYTEGGITQRELADRYNVSEANISFIITRRAWSWLTDA